MAKTPPFDVWIRSRTGWALSNILYEKLDRLPEISEILAWRILLVVWELRQDAKLSEKILDVHMSFDKKGSSVMDRLREYAEVLLPALAKERERQDRNLQRQLAEIGRMQPMHVEPIQGMHAWQSLRYAKSLAEKVR